MTQFNTHRFLSVAKWDLAINRSFYLKTSLLILALMALPAISSVLDMEVIQLEGMSEVTATYIIIRYLALLPFLCGYLLHNLRNRQGRMSELTLPASNLEKFLWHVCITLLGSLAVAVVSFFLIDLGYNTIIAVRHGSDNAEEFVVAFFRTYCNGIDDFGWESIWVFLIPLLTHQFTISTFALGNATKYKMNIALTILWNMAFCIALIFVLQVTFLLYLKIAYAGVYTGDLSLTDVVNLRLLVSLLCVALVCLTALCWWLAYRLYTRATITSRRNR